MMMKKILTGTAVALMLTTSAMAETTSKLFVYEQSKTQWLATSLIGLNVKNNDGKIIGDVNDMLFDKTGRVKAVVIGVGGFLGIGEKNIAVDFSAIEQKTSKDNKVVLLLDMSKKEVEEVPSFKKSDKNPNFITKVQEEASQVGEQIQETSSEAYKKTKELGEKAAEKAGELKDDVMGEKSTQKSAQ